MIELDPLESDIQKDIVCYLNIYKIKNCFKFFSVPNERKNQTRTNKLKAMGMTSGVSDLVIDHKGKVFYLEVKLPKEKQRPSQIVFQEECVRTNTPYEVVRSLDEARIQLDKWGIIKI